MPLTEQGRRLLQEEVKRYYEELEQENDQLRERCIQLYDTLTQLLAVCVAQDIRDEAVTKALSLIEIGEEENE